GKQDMLCLPFGKYDHQGYRHVTAEKPSCPAEVAMALLAGRWKLMIIYWLLQGTRRFNELQRDLGGITHRTLAGRAPLNQSIAILASSPAPNAPGPSSAPCRSRSQAARPA